MHQQAVGDAAEDLRCKLLDDWEAQGKSIDDIPVDLKDRIKALQKQRDDADKLNEKMMKKCNKEMETFGQNIMKMRKI